MDDSESEDALIKKTIISNGSKYIPLVDGTKVRFHYQTKTCPEKGEQVLLDDSKQIGRPMELIIGKKFKFEVWEAIVKKMSLNEIAKFHVHRSVSMHVTLVHSRFAFDVICFWFFILL